MHESNEIYAQYNDKTIRVYQAYNSKIAEECLRLGTFGPSFKIDRMTWIKPSFLWMMYRSGWGTKKNQERILAIDILKEGFNEILSKAVLSTYNSSVYLSYEEWKRDLISSPVRCQWDPDRDIYGNPIRRRTIQLGIKDDIVKKYVEKWIFKITDISEDVCKYNIMIQKGNFDLHMLPMEKIYFVDNCIRSKLGMDK
ncbi:DUF4291 domain-containing protein [Acetivibrio straminisolvens]|uniref:DUF4291 domain-containing protein n=1 Tax=Acetivibrio straminisolvens JCM 21531 TaxID=1294263 RepID=W4VDN9_9FIRM|nr:DUF4291 domain-containing protein [Acetivibrio straminisolvens]GAE90903.1 hypothetical protein JCM21531_4560 [Acetivibrio straminisolvens JCM 21531]